MAEAGVEYGSDTSTVPTATSSARVYSNSTSIDRISSAGVGAKMGLVTHISPLTTPGSLVPRDRSAGLIVTLAEATASVPTLVTPRKGELKTLPSVSTLLNPLPTSPWSNDGHIYFPYTTFILHICRRIPYPPHPLASQTKLRDPLYYPHFFFRASHVRRGKAWTTRRIGRKQLAGWYDWEEGRFFVYLHRLVRHIRQIFDALGKISSHFLFVSRIVHLSCISISSA